MGDTINETESLLYKIEIETKNIGFFFNASKTKAMHFNLLVESYIYAMNGDEIEKVDDVLYLGG